MQLTLRETDLAALLGELEATIRHEAAAKGLHLRVYLGPGLPCFINADGRRLRQVQFNLLANAINTRPPRPNLAIFHGPAVKQYTSQAYFPFRRH